MPCYLIHFLRETSVAELLYHLGIGFVPEITNKTVNQDDTKQYHQINNLNCFCSKKIQLLYFIFAAFL